MSVNLNNSISAGFKFLANQVANVSDKLGGITSSLLHGATTTLEVFRPNSRPRSVGDLITQTKEAGNVLLETPGGDYLIEITQNEQGKYIFRAIGESLKPVIYHEGAEGSGRALWEVQVSYYLRKIVYRSESASYGSLTSRWKGGAFDTLKETLSSEGLLNETSNKVRLKLPEERAIVFKGPDASMKTDMVLKHYYQRRKTPQEDKSGALSRLLVQYLHIFHHASAPWKKESWPAGDSSQDNNEFKAIALNPPFLQHMMKMSETNGGNSIPLAQFEEMAIESNGYVQPYFSSTFLDQSQKIAMNTATVYLATLLTVQNPKIALLSTLFQMVTQAHAASAPQVRQIREIQSDAMISAMRRTAPITILSPLPNLSVQPGTPLNYNIDLSAYCQLSNPYQNMELSIQQVNGLPAPGWISMSMGPLSPLSTTFIATGQTTDVYVVGNLAYVTLDSGGGLNIVDVTNPKNPAVVGTFSATYTREVIVSGNYAYIIDFNLVTNGYQLQVINISIPSNTTLTKTLSFGANFLCGITLVNNYLYLAGGTTAGSNLLIFSLTNPANPTQIGSLPINDESYELYVSGIYAFIIGGNKIYIVNVGVPSAPVLITTIPFPEVVCCSIAAKGNHLFVGSGDNLYIYDITTISNPILVKSIYLGQTSASELTIEGNYLYSTVGSNVIIVDITNAQNARLVSSFPTLGSGGNTFLSGNNVFVANGVLTIINAGSRTLSGTPLLQNDGLLVLNVTAQDDMGDSLVQQIGVQVGNINVVPPPNQQVYVGNATMFTLPTNTFQLSNATFTASAQLTGGLPLPSFIHFDPSSHTFLIAPQTGNQGTYRIQVTGDNGYGGVASTTFDVVVPDRIPVLAQPLGNQTAYSGNLFQYIVAANSFTDADNDQLVYTANTVGSNVLNGLPGWLSFNPALLKFSGEPFGRGVYQIQLNANDEFGGITSGTFTITVPPSAPLLQNSIGTQLASVANPFRFSPNTNTFFSVDGDSLILSASGLPSFLSFINGTFTGTPQAQDVGTSTISLTATNPFGQSVTTSFTLTVLSASNDLPPVLVLEIPDLTQTAGIPFNYTINTGTFEDPQHQTLTYTATLEGGAPLPSGLNFNANTLILWGVVSQPQSMRITIKATDPYGAFAIDTFALNVIDGTKYPPIVLNSIPGDSATVGELFSKQVPANTFQALNEGELTLTANQSDGQPLPAWLHWNPGSQFFTGTPGPGDTDPFTDKILNIDVWAKDSVGSAKASFVLSVGGASYWSMLLKYGSIAFSIAGTTYGVWKERAIIWNILFKKKYQKTDSETAIVGEEYSHRINLSRLEVKEISCIINGKPLSQIKPLPDGLVYKENKIQGIPTGEDTGRFTVRVIGEHGYIHEEFELIIKNKFEADPEKQQPTCLESSTARISGLFPNCTSRGESDEGEEQSRFGWCGRIKAGLPKSFRMKEMNTNENNV